MHTKMSPSVNFRHITRARSIMFLSDTGLHMRDPTLASFSPIFKETNTLIVHAANHLINYDRDVLRNGHFQQLDITEHSSFFAINPFCAYVFAHIIITRNFIIPWLVRLIVTSQKCFIYDKCCCTLPFHRRSLDAFYEDRRRDEKRGRYVGMDYDKTS